MRFISIALLTWGMAVSVPALASDASDWLARMVQAEQHRSFNGIFIYERNGALSTHQVWQRVDPAGDVHARLLQLDGPAHEVFSFNGQVQCLGGGLGGQFSKETYWPGQGSDLSEISRYFDLRLVGDARVAGHDAVVIAVVPRDQHRYGFELHLDRQSGLPLKSILLDEKGEPLERLQFTQLSVADTLEPAVLQPTDGCRKVNVEKRQAAYSGGWGSEWLPPGFTLKHSSESVQTGSGSPVVMLSYAGPLARFSVFLEPLNGARVDDARSQLGPTVVVSKRLPTEGGDVMVTVIGEVPLGTAERVALSMRDRGAAAP